MIKAVAQEFGYLIRVFRGQKSVLPIKLRVCSATSFELGEVWGIDAIDELMNVAEGHVRQSL